MIGIYKITNLLNGNAYIGQSIDIEYRWYQHFNEAYKDNRGDYNTAFHKAIRKYGENNFKKEVLEECKLEELNEREVFWIQYYNTYNGKGYNMTPGGKSLKGESHPKAKLQEGEVIEIRKRWAACNISTRELYYDYQDRIGKSGFKKIYTWQTWKNIFPELNTPERREWHRNNGISYSNALSKTNTAHLKDDEYLDIFSRYTNGEKISNIWKDYKNSGYKNYKSFYNSIHSMLERRNLL